MGKANVTRFTKIVSSHASLALDSSCFIYHIEENKKYISLTEVLFETMLSQGVLSALGSTLLLTEVLTRPMEEGRGDLVLAYKSLIVGFPHFQLFPLDEDIAEKAAFFRSRYNLRTPDAIHVATAVVHGAGAIIGNDTKWKLIKELDIIVLDEFIS